MLPDIQGCVPGGLIVHPDQNHLIYSVGNTIIVENIVSNKQRFLVGHTDNVSCIAVSKSGRYIASGQVTHMGFKADVIVWDYETCSKYCLLTLHKVKVEALAFSPNDIYLVSLGGQDDNRYEKWNFLKLTVRHLHLKFKLVQRVITHHWISIENDRKMSLLDLRDFRL